MKGADDDILTLYASIIYRYTYNIIVYCNIHFVWCILYCAAEERRKTMCTTIDFGEEGEKDIYPWLISLCTRVAYTSCRTRRHPCALRRLHHVIAGSLEEGWATPHPPSPPPGTSNKAVYTRTYVILNSNSAASSLGRRWLRPINSPRQSSANNTEIKCLPPRPCGYYSFSLL